MKFEMKFSFLSRILEIKFHESTYDFASKAILVAIQREEAGQQTSQQPLFHLFLKYKYIDKYKSSKTVKKSF